ncbi:PTS system, cellobiose-specific IIC component [Enterococcus sp. DIV2402]|uniref:Permease IIC component n=1 Tax=Candidatus Enterococcus lowellii TaxID=2230877 RepID=A0ABZ2SQ38_9ENTE|nr:PTS transporter subunit EIIC [Enterococcus sp. DIV2402]MBO0464061.1 PTS sugar transporter subunit IIC [Enterococcus sp. DIV2402]
MKPFINWLEGSFTPRMNKINHNTWIVTLKDSIMQALPLIFLGSLFAMLAILNDYFPSLPNFWVLYGWTMGMISLIISFLIPFNLMEKKRLRKQRINAGMSGVILFLIIISPQVIADGQPGFSHSALGAGGMFVAIISGLFAGFVLNMFGKFSFFKEESVIPDFVRAWFDAMLPIGIVIIIGWLLVDLLKFDVYNSILAIFMPLQNVVETPWGFSLMMFIVCFLYSLGISTWVLTPVINPVLLTAIQANIDGTSQNLVTDPTIYSAYLWIGGIGCTMPLVFMLIRSKSKKLKALGTASILPTFFNINEPIVFGAIAWNPLLMIPMWLQGIILPLVVWFFTKVIAFAPIPMINFQMWYCPFPISTWLTTGSISGILLMLIIFIISAAIWYPFFKTYEKQECEKELKEIN